MVMLRNELCNTEAPTHQGPLWDAVFSTVTEKHTSYFKGERSPTTGCFGLMFTAASSNSSLSAIYKKHYLGYIFQNSESCDTFFTSYE